MEKPKQMPKSFKMGVQMILHSDKVVASEEKQSKSDSVFQKLINFFDEIKYQK